MLGGILLVAGILTSYVVFDVLMADFFSSVMYQNGLFVLLFVFIFQVLFASKKEADAAIANRYCKNCYHYVATQGTCQHTGNHHANPERERCAQHSFRGEAPMGY